MFCTVVTYIIQRIMKHSCFCNSAATAVYENKTLTTFKAYILHKYIEQTDFVVSRTNEHKHARVISLIPLKTS